MNKLMRNTMYALLGASFTFSVMAAPLASANATNVKTTVKSYDMDEYLDMLLASGQYEKYDRFIKIADPSAYAKHIANYSQWENGYPVYADQSSPVYAMQAVAQDYGFDGPDDTFTLLSRTDNKAVVQVHHDSRIYYASMVNENGTWQVKAVYRI